MPMVLLLLPGDTQACLQERVLARLVRLGVTRIAVVRDERSLGVVVEGWALDPTRSAGAVMRAISGRRSGGRAFQPLMEMTLMEGED